MHAFLCVVHFNVSVRLGYIAASFCLCLHVRMSVCRCESQMLSNGIGSERNTTEAQQWAERAAELGSQAAAVYGTISAPL